MKKKKDLEDIKHTWKCNSLEIEKEMKRIADNIFGYNPKTDPRDPLFRKTLSWSVKKEGKGKKNEKNDWNNKRIHNHVSFYYFSDSVK